MVKPTVTIESSEWKLSLEKWLSLDVKSMCNFRENRKISFRSKLSRFYACLLHQNYLHLWLSPIIYYSKLHIFIFFCKSRNVNGLNVHNCYTEDEMQNLNSWNIHSLSNLQSAKMFLLREIITFPLNLNFYFSEFGLAYNSKRLFLWNRENFTGKHGIMHGTWSFRNW